MLAHFSKLPILILFLLWIVNCIVHAKNENLQQMDWKNTCEELKLRYLSNSQLNVVFSKKPEIKATNSFWLLKWHDIEIPLPSTSYKDIYVSIGKEGKYELILASFNGLVISVSIFSNEPTSDVFASAKIGSEETKSSQRGALTTKAMFGGPVTNSDLFILGYQTTPKDLTCQDDKMVDESAKAVALILKGIAWPGELLSVHNGVGDFKGWIEKGRINDKFRYVIHIIPEDNQKLIFQISYRIPENERYHDLPFILGKKHIEESKQPPVWLSALNLAIGTMSEDNWKNYISKAKEVGISEKSTRRVFENLKISKKP